MLPCSAAAALLRCTEQCRRCCCGRWCAADNGNPHTHRHQRPCLWVFAAPQHTHTSHHPQHAPAHWQAAQAASAYAGIIPIRDQYDEPTPTPAQLAPAPPRGDLDDVMRFATVLLDSFNALQTVALLQLLDAEDAKDGTGTLAFPGTLWVDMEANLMHMRIGASYAGVLAAAGQCLWSMQPADLAGIAGTTLQEAAGRWRSPMQQLHCRAHAPDGSHLTSLMLTCLPACLCRCMQMTCRRQLSQGSS